MKISLYFIPLSKRFALSSCFLLIGLLGTAGNITDHSSMDCVCLNPEELSVESFLKIYASLDDAARREPANAMLLETRKLFLHRLFLAFGESTPQTNRALYDLLMRKIAYIGFCSPEDLERNIKENSIDWQDFKAFVEFYAPHTEAYKALPILWQQGFIDTVIKDFQGKL